MAIQFPAGRRIERVADMVNRDQNNKTVNEGNALINDSNRLKNMGAQTEYDDEQKVKVARQMQVISKRGQEMMQQNPNAYSQMLPDLMDKFKEMGLRTDTLPPAGASPDKVMEGLVNMGRMSEEVLATLAPQMQDVAAEDAPQFQRHPGTGKVSVVGATPSGPSGPQKNYAQRQQLVNQYGEGSPQVQTFDSYVRAGKITDVAGVPTEVGPGGDRPLSTQDAELNFDRASAQATEEGSRLGKPTTAQEKIDQAYAPEYVAFTQGGYQDATKGIEQLSSVQEQLNTPGAELTGWKIAGQPDVMLAVTNPEALQAREQVEEVVQRNLRLILGAQFTEKEGVRLIARAYNPWMDEKYNAIRINRLVKSIREAANAKVAAAKHYEESGTLAGFESKVNYSISDFYDVLDEQVPLTVGDIYNGREYLGGNPNDRTSWK